MTSPRGSFTIKVSTFVAMIICVVLTVLDIAIFKSKLFDPYSFFPDGAYYQYLYIVSLIEQGALWEAALENPITLTHVFRFVVYTPFTTMGELNIPLQYLLLVVIAFPVINHYFVKPIHLLLFLPLILPFFISYRAVFAALSIGYLTIYLFSDRRYGYFILAMLLSLISSAVAVQLFFLILFYSVLRERRFLLRLRHLVPFGLLLTLLILTFAIKIQGFLLGLEGYAATTGNGAQGLLVTILSRGTLFYDLFRGSARGYLYAAVAAVFLYAVFRSVFSRHAKASDYRLALFTLAPGFLAEGLGVTSITFILLWALLRIDLQSSRRRRPEVEVVPQRHSILEVVT